MAALEAIIERDYFPDVPKLQSKLEWLEAVKSGNPSAIRRAQINIARRRAGLKTPVSADFERSGLTAPSTSIQPGANLATPALTPLQAATPSATAAAPAASTDDSRAPGMSLDQYLLQHTSEDNASFSSLVAEGEKRRQIKYQHHLEDKNRRLQLEGPFPTDEYGTSGQQPDTRRTWHHTSKSWLYYDASEHPHLPLSVTELSSVVQGPPKAVDSRQTRLADEASDPAATEATIPIPGPSSAAFTATASTPHPHSHPAQHPPGYNVLATPSYIPGVDASPFMTWGDIESTPLRLDADDISLDPNHSRGPQFSLNPVSVREQVARSLASHASKSIKNKALAKLGGSSAGRSAATPLSEAGQRLASKLKGNTGGVGDRQLRASYTGTPLLQRTATQTPVPSSRLGTPFRGGGGKGGGSKPPEGALPHPGAGSITDNLLKL